MLNWFTTSTLKSSPLLIGLSLAACDGGGGGGSPSFTTKPIKPGGYATEISFSGGSTVDAVTLLSPKGDFVVIVDFDNIIVGTLRFGSSGSILGSETEFYFDGSWQTRKRTISGETLSNSRATIKASAPGHQSTSTLVRDDQYSDLGVTLAGLGGTYTMDVAGAYRTSMTISADGTVTGSDDTGCVFSGNVVIPDTRYNVYEVSYTAALCSNSQRNGQYSGLGAYDTDLTEIQFAAANDELAAFFIGDR